MESVYKMISHQIQAKPIKPYALTPIRLNHLKRNRLIPCAQDQLITINVKALFTPELRV